MVSLECDSCLVRLNAEDRRPKLLHCGHTACLRCLADWSRDARALRCSKCSKVTEADPDTLCDNLDRLYFLEVAAGKAKAPTPAPAPKKFWCLECKAAANDYCMEEHVLNRMQPSHHKQVKRAARAERMERSTARLQRQLRETREGLTVAMEALKEARDEVFGEPGSTSSTAKPSEPVKVIPELNIHALGQLCGANERYADKVNLVNQVRRNGVVRLSDVYCLRDPDWSAALIRAGLRSLEQAHVVHPREEHLQLLLGAPRLRRLAIWSDDATDLFTRPPVLPPPDRPARLEWLSARLPRCTLRSLLLADAASLRTLRLRVGPPGPRPWPRNCGDLDALLAECGLAALRSLVLLRDCFAQDRAACAAQLEAVRRALPAAAVQCKDCDKARYEPF